jgi:hypothetical protein
VTKNVKIGTVQMSCTANKEENLTKALAFAGVLHLQIEVSHEPLKNC